MKRLIAASVLVITIFSFSPAKADSRALFEQGMEAFKSSNYKNAELLFRKCIDEDDNNAEKAWFFLARSLYSQKRYKDAVFEFNRFLVNCRTIEYCIESRFWIAESWYSSSEFIKAIEEYKRYISQNKDKDNQLVSVSHERIADIYARQQRYDEAVIEWKLASESISQDDKKNALSLRIADAMFRNKKADEAEGMLVPLSSNKDIQTAALANILLGRISLSREKNRVALWYFSRVPDSLLSANPFCDTLYFRGMTYLALDDKDTAKSFLQSFINTGKQSTWYNYARFQLAKLAEMQNQAESISIMEEIRTAGTDRELAVELAIELEKLYQLQGKAEMGIPFLEEVRSAADPERQKDVLYELGGAYTAAKKYKEAEAVFSGMLEKYSFDKDADRIQFQLAVVYLKKGDSVRAADGFQKISSLNPFSTYLGEANYYMASARYDQADSRGALKFIDEYLKNPKGDKRYEAYLLQLRALIQLSDYAGAEKSAGNIVRRYADHVGVDRVLMDFIQFANSAKQDVSYYENFILRTFPDGESAADIYLFKAGADFAKGSWKRAEQMYSSYLKIKGNEANPRAFINKGICIYRQNNFQGVITYLSSEKFEFFSGEYSSEIVILLAKAMLYTGKADKAYEYFTTANEYINEPEDIDCYFEASIKNDNIAFAKELSQRLRGDKPRYFRSLYEIGLYYKDIFGYEEARGYFSRVYTDYPDSTLSDQALLELSFLDIKDARYDEAVSRLKIIKSKSLETRKTVISITVNYKMGRYSEGMDLLRKNIDAIIKEPETKGLLKSTIEYLVSNDDAATILTYGRYISSYYPDEQDYMNVSVANIYYREKNYNKAYSYFSKVQQTKGEYLSEVIYRLALIQELYYKNTRSAVQLFQQLVESADSDEYVSAARLELSILYYEKGQKDLSAKTLSEIIGRKENVAAIIKASNVISYYSLATETAPTGVTQDGTK
jgi:tetratricopeptide (TPR) repeat protein